MRKALVLCSMAFAVWSASAGTSVISDSSDPVTPGRIVDSPDPIMHGVQDGPDTVPHRSIVRVVPPPVVVPSAPGEVVRVSLAPIVVGTLCDDAGNCWSEAVGACYDNLIDCAQTASDTCGSTGHGAGTGAHITTCQDAPGAPSHACCVFTCSDGASGDCSPN